MFKYFVANHQEWTHSTHVSGDASRRSPSLVHFCLLYNGKVRVENQSVSLQKIDLFNHIKINFIL